MWRAATTARVEVWNRQTGQSLGAYDRGNDNIASIDFSVDGKLLALADEKEATLLDFSKLTELSEERVGKAGRRRLPPHPALVRRFEDFEGDVTQVVFSPDDRLLATGDRSGNILLWDFRTGENVATLDTEMVRVDRICFSPEGERLVAVGSKTGQIWNVATGKLVSKLVGHLEGIRGVAFAVDGTRIATGSADKTVRIWDAETAAQLCKLEVEGSVFSVGFSPSGDRLAATHSEGVSIWQNRSNCLPNKASEELSS